MTHPFPTRRSSDLTNRSTATGTAAGTAAAGTAAKSGMSRWLGPIAGIAAGLGIAALLSHLGLSGAFAEFLSSMLLIGLVRSEEHTSELQSLMRISYAVFCLKKKKKTNHRSA